MFPAHPRPGGGRDRLLENPTRTHTATGRTIASAACQRHREHGFGR